MITKEVRARVVKTIVGHDDNVNVTTNVRVLRQYEDTVTELEERLKGVVSETKEMQELMYMWDLKGIAKDELEGYEQAVILELIEHCESIVSQLERGMRTVTNELDKQELLNWLDSIAHNSFRLGEYESGNAYNHVRESINKGHYNSNRVAELEGQLKIAERILRKKVGSETKGCYCAECSLTREVKRFISQLEKGDKT